MAGSQEEYSKCLFLGGLLGHGLLLACSHLPGHSLLLGSFFLFGGGLLGGLLLGSSLLLWCLKSTSG